MRGRDALSPAEARRAVLAAQGFGLGGGRSDTRSLLRSIRRMGLVQIDSVNVLTRAHYLPAFSRIGAYDRSRLDAAGARAPRTLFEYWGHEASLLPVERQPLLRWRMAEPHAWGSVAAAAQSDPGLVTEVLDCVAAIGPATATTVERELEHGAARGTDRWGWNWSAVKQILEHLFWSGEVTSGGRDAQFRRRYALPEAVLPQHVRHTPTPDRAEAIRGLVDIAARALGVATAVDLRDYFRLNAADTMRAVTELVEDGALLPVDVPGWPAAWRHHSVVVPRRLTHDALLVPFDPLIWERSRVQRLFDMRYRIEIYVPKAQRAHGYYVLPFLQDEHLRARVDLKADRARGTLQVQGTWGHQATSDTSDRLAAELGRLATWLGLAEVSVAANGDLATRLATAVTRISVR